MTKNSAHQSIYSRATALLVHPRVLAALGGALATTSFYAIISIFKLW